MPYIEPCLREAIDRRLKGITDFVSNGGDLNYAITTLILEYLNCSKRYEYYNEVMGVLECVKHELYRKAIAPYENEKAQENGDLKW